MDERKRLVERRRMLGDHLTTLQRAVLTTEAMIRKVDHKISELDREKP